MDLNKYQLLALSTAIYPKEMGLTYTALGLVGEAGEVANKVKKVLRDHGGVLTPEMALAIKSEVGDCLWYLATISSELGYTLEEIAQSNLNKLNSRMIQGKLTGSGDNREDQ